MPGHRIYRGFSKRESSSFESHRPHLRPRRACDNNVLSMLGGGPQSDRDSHSFYGDFSILRSPEGRRRTLIVSRSVDQSDGLIAKAFKQKDCGFDLLLCTAQAAPSCAVFSGNPTSSARQVPILVRFADACQASQDLGRRAQSIRRSSQTRSVDTERQNRPTVPGW